MGTREDGQSGSSCFDPINKQQLRGVGGLRSNWASTPPPPLPHHVLYSFITLLIQCLQDIFEFLPD